jgi:heat shock protein HtpX
MYSQIASNRRKSLLLIAVFIGFILALGWIVGQEVNAGAYASLPLAFILSLGMSLVGFYSGDRVALWTASAKPLAKQDNPYIYRLVENLCLSAGLPCPKIYLISDPAPNAFATGRSPKHASLALTSGLVEQLKNEELEGVIAHELSHIKNYDIRLMMLVVVLAGTLVLFRDLIWRSIGFGGRKRGNKEGGQGVLLFFIIGLVLSILAPLIAELIKLAISRKREFLADASGALLTRYPEGLASALEKIAAYQMPLKQANQATAHLFIASPFGERAKRGLANLFSTHPPIKERIKALRSMGV